MSDSALSLASVVGAVPQTPGPVPPTARGLVAAADGTASGTLQNGDVVGGWPLIRGYNPVRFTVITAVDVTIWAYF